MMSKLILRFLWLGLFIGSCIIPNLLFAQPNLFKYEDIPVKWENRTLAMPWFGGFNNPIISDIDMNNDGVKDLYIFEMVTWKHYTFINNGTPNQVDYEFAPEYINHFPDLWDFVILEDYDCDGIDDIFSYSIAGIQVWKGYYDNDTVNFEFITFRLEHPDPNGQPFNQPVYADRINLPAFVDVDFDTDLDILGFEQFGGHVAYYQNMSDEMGFGCDSLIFEKRTNCWGEFCECSPITNQITLKDGDPWCRWYNFTPPQHESDGPDTIPTRHTGSTLLSFDEDGDDAVELLVGDASFDNMIMLRNKLNAQNRDCMISQDTAFPSYDTPIDLPVFPAAYLLDVNNDAKQDLLIAPFNMNFCRLDPLFDTTANIHNIHLYQNVDTGSNYDFSFVQDDFMVNGMMDIGENAHPAFFDFNGDGKLDIIAGNCYSYTEQSNLNKGLTLLKNIGEKWDPEYELVTHNYAGLDSLELIALRPTFGDLDDDGDMDMLIGEQLGTMYYFENISNGPTDSAEFMLADNFFEGIDVGEFSTPQLVDVDSDEVLDIITGEKVGRVFYYHNTGTKTNYSFADTATSDWFGEIDVRNGQPFGFSVPFLTKNPVNQSMMLVGNITGNMFLYDNIDNNLNGVFSIADSSWTDERDGSRLSPYGGDINNGGLPEFIVGLSRGGFKMYTMGDSPVGVHEPYSTLLQDVRIIPNPASDLVKIVLPASISTASPQIVISIIDLTGRQVYRDVQSHRQPTVDIRNIPDGVYVIQIEIAGNAENRKLVISR